MTIVILVLAYLANVFLAREINKRLHNIDDNYKPLWGIWLIPIIGVLSYVVVLLIELGGTKRNWFTGKNW
jgi:hypothetical protein